MQGYASKVLHILRVLWEESDEQHPVSATYIARRLEERDVACERKSVYAYLDILEDFGLDVVRVSKGAYLATRWLELPELLLLADAMRASHSITERKSQELIRKLSEMLSCYQGKEFLAMTRGVNAVKAENESIYYSIDAIRMAMEKNRQVTFQYANWNRHKELELRHGGKWYQVSPWKLCWERERYYLVGYEEASSMTKYFRIDKIRNLQGIEKPRSGEDISVESECKERKQENATVFGMFQGIETEVVLNANQNLLGTIMDRFGRDVWLHMVDERNFRMKAMIQVSNQFYGWLVGLGRGVQIVEPAWVKEQYCQLLRDILSDTE